VRLDKDYKWAVVSSPGKDYLWILSRSPKMEETIFSSITEDLNNDGYDVNRLVKVPQEDCN
jgi:apolipoprotein D and lipocalin family protein